ncbi:hypothetical protein PQX77_016466 [Marasmius sp. AFHP31]|nr:hypothetical protein PQX77_016466 [Marasmius sp. AFHP31]
MGLIWLKHPVHWRSSRVASYNFTGWTEEQQKLVQSKWFYWYEADWDYAQPTVIFFCVAVACAMGLHVIFLLRNRTSSARPASGLKGTLNSALDKITAVFRYTTSKQYRLRVPFLTYYSPPLAAIIAVAGIFAFIMGMMLGPRPYEWPTMKMGMSAPIATRSGWLALAMMPFMVAFAMKVNLITMLTGVSHEKMQVLHRWTAFIMYIPTLVHTFFYIVGQLQMHSMEKSWRTTNWYWTGVAALVPQTYLIFFSWGFFRNQYYEIFKKIHFVAAALFILFFFIHCSFRLTSWDYFAVTWTIFFISWFTRLFRGFYNAGFGLPAEAQLLPGSNLVKVTVQTPNRLKWKPGQHVFMRVLNAGIHAMSNHPFTVSSLTEDGVMELVFNVRGRRGITSKLARMAEGKRASRLRVIIDGPYGGLPCSLTDFDHVYLLAGGTGATFTIPILANLVGKTGNVKSIEFIASVKKRDAANWIVDSLSDRNIDILSRSIHITDAEDQFKLSQKNNSAHGNHETGLSQDLEKKLASEKPASGSGSGAVSESSSVTEHAGTTTEKNTGARTPTSVVGASEGSSLTEINRLETRLVPGRPDVECIIRGAQKQSGRVAIIG